MPTTTTTTPRAAVIGLGSMGHGMALSLLRAGFEVIGCDVSTALVERFVGEGGKDILAVVVVQDDAVGNAERAPDRGEDDLGQAAAVSGRGSRGRRATGQAAARSS